MTHAQLVRQIMELAWLLGHEPFPVQRNENAKALQLFRSGSPDVIVCTRSGRFIGLEAKRGRDRLSRKQKEVRDRLPDGSFFEARPDTYVEILEGLK